MCFYPYLGTASFLFCLSECANKMWRSATWLVVFSPQNGNSSMVDPLTFPALWGGSSVDTTTVTLALLHETKHPLCASHIEAINDITSLKCSGSFQSSHLKNTQVIQTLCTCKCTCACVCPKWGEYSHSGKSLACYESVLVFTFVP